MTEDLIGKLLLMCKTVSDTEWSGVLEVTKESGDLSDSDSEMVFKAIDFILMSIDTPGNTGFDWNDPILFDRSINAKEGTLFLNLHSHHDLGAFFSGQDLSELRDKAEDNFYLMLVVDNKGIDSWKVKCAWPTDEKITKTISGFFGFTSKQIEEEVRVINEMDLDISCEEEGELTTRIEEIGGYQKAVIQPEIDYPSFRNQYAANDYNPDKWIR